MKSPRFYLAAPFFSDAELAFNELVLHVMEGFGEVFAPQRDGLRMHDLAAEVGTSAAMARIFECDVSEIDKSDVVIAILDGAGVDVGVAWELGYAHAKGKVVVAVRTDNRSFAWFGGNPMIDGSVAVVVASVAELQCALKALMERWRTSSCRGDERGCRGDARS